jgi:glycosyltransferase family protein
MKKSLPQRLIHSVRNSTPLSLRQKIGPILGRVYYAHRLYIEKKKPHILSIESTITTILEKNLSVIRFGDGEIALIDGTSLAFQKYDEKLASRLEDVIRSDEKNMLICIPGMWGRLEKLEPYAYHFVMHHMYRQRHIWNSLLSSNRVYGDTNMTRHYLAYKDNSNAGFLFKKIFTLWEGKNVVLVEGSGSRLGVGNDMFNNVASLERILCPPENAFASYEKILTEVKKQDKTKLVLISLGPTAKILAYDLFKDGFRVLDIGHIDMEYEMYLRKQKLQTKVDYKYFNEINERSPAPCTDQNYIKQIISTIQ